MLKAILLSLAIAGFSGAQQPPTKTADAPPDNTKVNRQGELSASSQKNNKTDLAITRDIRKALIADKTLSTYAHNVKVITENGNVTLKGPVRSDEEKRAVAAKAIDVAGRDHVADELTIAPPKK